MGICLKDYVIRTVVLMKDGANFSCREPYHHINCLGLLAAYRVKEEVDDLLL